MNSPKPTTVEVPTVEVPYGTFQAPKYQIIRNSSEVGIVINLTFMPRPEEEAAKQPVGLIQTVRLRRTEMTIQDQYSDEPLKVQRMTGSGTHIDQSTYVNEKGGVLTEAEAKKMWATETKAPIPQTNPVYVATNTAASTAKTLLANTGTNNFGAIYLPGGTDPARLIDAPSRLILPDETIEHVFEVAAITLTEPYRYLGSVTWGYIAKVGKKITEPEVLPQTFQKLGEIIPSEEFFAAAALWNGQKVIDYGLNEKIARVQIPLVSKKEVGAENIEANFGSASQTEIFKGVKKEYLLKGTKRCVLVGTSSNVYTFMVYE